MTFVCINHRPECAKTPKGKLGECVKCYMRRYMRTYKQRKRQRLLHSSDLAETIPRKIMTRSATKTTNTYSDKDDSDMDYLSDDSTLNYSNYSPIDSPISNQQVYQIPPLSTSPVSITSALISPIPSPQSIHRSAFDCLLEEVSERYNEVVNDIHEAHEAQNSQESQYKVADLSVESLLN